MDNLDEEKQEAPIGNPHEVVDTEAKLARYKEQLA